MSNLIEKDALKRKHCDSCACKSNCMGEGCKIYEARCLIADLPTIEAEPVRHGEWVETEPDEDDRKIGIEFSIKCSRCHDENSHLDFNENHEITGKTFWTSRFCPNCGARMDLRTPTEAQLDMADSVMMGGAENGN